MRPHVFTDDLRHAAVENATAPQVGINQLALPALRAASSGSPSQRQVRRAVSTDVRARNFVSDVSRRRACDATLTRETRLDEVRTWSDLSFAIGGSSAATPGRGRDVHPTHAPDRGVVCQR